jgi:phosphoserine phosphatase
MRWPPYHHIIFDCDSTLTTVEGIDVLGDLTGQRWHVETLTRAAMDGDMELEEVYDRRLQLVQPNRRQVNAIRYVYKQNIVEDAKEVIGALQTLGHKVYIISGGLAEAVSEFGVYLGVPRENIRAVNIRYNELSGTWWFNHNQIADKEKQLLDIQDGALTESDGKAAIVGELLGEQRGRSLLVGDGVSDLLASRAVDLFTGYGGVVTRKRVLAEAPAFLHSTSLSPLLALAAGPAVLPLLRDTPYRSLVTKSMTLIEKGAMTFQNERLRKKFEQAYQAFYSRTD